MIQGQGDGNASASASASGSNNAILMGIRSRQMMVSAGAGPLSSNSAGAGSLNTITPCAACKLLRRRCAEECPFSPYFSPHEPHKFAAVHKIFGASNVSKMLMEVPESQRADAANSLVYEANLRIRDPVYGCMGAISALQHQIQSLQGELDAVRAEILRYKYRELATSSSMNNTTRPAPAVTLLNISAPPTLSSPASQQDSIIAPPPQSQPTPSPPPNSDLVASSTSSTSSSNPNSLYSAPPTSTTAYTSISTDHNNVPYFE